MADDRWLLVIAISVFSASGLLYSLNQYAAGGAVWASPWFFSTAFFFGIFLFWHLLLAFSLEDAGDYRDKIRRKEEVVLNE